MEYSSKESSNPEHQYRGWMIASLQDWLGWTTYIAGPNYERMELYTQTKAAGETLARQLIDSGGYQDRLL